MPFEPQNDGWPGTASQKITSRDAAPPGVAPNTCLGCLFQTSLKVRTELFEHPKTDSLSDSPHDVKVKVDVVVGVQDGRQKFSRCIQMA